MKCGKCEWCTSDADGAGVGVSDEPVGVAAGAAVTLCRGALVELFRETRVRTTRVWEDKRAADIRKARGGFGAVAAATLIETAKTARKYARRQNADELRRKDAERKRRYRAANREAGQ